MEKAKLRSYLVISGDDLDFQAIQDFTGIAPTRVRRGGEFPGPGHGADEWVYEISGVYVFPIPADFGPDRPPYPDVMMHFDEIESLFTPVADDLGAWCAEHGAAVCLGVEARSETDELPLLDLSESFVDFAARLGASMAYDVYTNVDIPDGPALSDRVELEDDVRAIGWAVVNAPFPGREGQEALDAIQGELNAYLNDLEARPWMLFDRTDQAIMIRAVVSMDSYYTGAAAMVDSFQHIARVAPNAYGELFLRQDGDKYGDHVKKTSSMVVLGRGESTFVEDPFFSPCVPSIEGFDPDEENPALQDYVDKYLPLGTVVVLKDGDKPLMVFGRQQKDTANDQVFDYVGCPFPEGNVGPRATFLFNHDDIAWIHFLGYADDEEWAWDDRLTGVNE